MKSKLDRSKSVKTVSIFLNNHRNATWSFDVSDKIAEAIKSNYESPMDVLTIDNVETKQGLMTICITKSKIDYITIV